MGLLFFLILIVLGFVDSQLVPVINFANVKNVSLSQCHLLPADIIFVLDDSGSVGSANYQKEKNFVKEFVKEFDVGPRNVQFGVISFSSTSHEYIKLNMYPTKNSLLGAIDKLPYESGGTNTAEALLNALNHGFSLSHGDRNPVTNVLMVITDGQSNDKASTAAAAAKLHTAGISVFGIGVGNTSPQEIKAIASDKDHEFHVDNFDALYKLKDDLRNRTCEAIAYSSLHCQNNIGNCNLYNHAVCIANAQWARQNCPLFCGYCAAQGIPTISHAVPQGTTTSQPITPTIPRRTTTQIMTPPPFSPGICEDKFGNCAGYGAGVCNGYRDWAIQNCARFCRFCHDTSTLPIILATFKTPSPPCMDKLSNCAAYGSNACMFYKTWAEMNCRKTCGICGFATPSLAPPTTRFPITMAPVSVTTTTTAVSTTSLSTPSSTKSTTIFKPIVTMPSVTVVGECKDHFNPGVCESYGPTMCFQLTAWAARQCPKYCAFCTPPTTTTTPPPTTTTTEPPCIDVDPTCQQKGPFVCVQNKTWAEHNCRVFCLICTPTTTAVPTTTTQHNTTVVQTAKPTAGSTGTAVRPISAKLPNLSPAIPLGTSPPTAAPSGSFVAFARIHPYLVVLSK